ncbi:MAG: lipoate--protein ligase family protein [Candidatus Bipolaricaulota bacterium]|nr:lipoate--protein ligase family protein [Candidatus Bipolaricaulota bacterium]
MRRRIDLLPEPASRGLALDEALLESVRGGGEPILRFWIGDRAVVIGRSQRVADEVDLAAVERAGVPVVRRASGGGAVLHYPGNLNVSVVVPSEAAGGVEEAFERLGACVAGAVCGMGADARAEGTAVVSRLGKLSGAAQARRGRAVLYHCTLLLEPDAVPMERYLRALRAGYAPTQIPSRPRPTTTLSELLGRRVGPQEAAAALGSALTRVLGDPDGGDGLTAEEVERAETLRLGRYEDPTWTWRE